MEAGSAAPGTGSGVTGSTELARNALSLPAILFCIVTGSAPLAAMMFNDPLSGYGIGISVPAAFWLSTIAFTLFSVGYVEMARRKTTAGGIYSYMAYGFGRIVGLGAAFGIAAAYILFAAGVNGVTSYFAQTSILNLSGGFDMDWRIYAFCFIALMFLVTYFHVEIVARILGVLLIGEIIILMIFSFAVVVKGGGPDGIVWQALNPAGLFSGGEGVDGAAAVFGVGAAGIGFFAAFWSWVGFEMAPNYAEESRNPKKMMAYAIYISCIGLGVLYTFWSWMVISAYGTSKDQWVWAIATQYGAAGDNPAGFARQRPSDRRLRKRLLSGRAGVRRDRNRELLQGADHHRLVRLRARVLADVQPLHLRDGPGGHHPAFLRPDARNAQEPVRRDGLRRPDGRHDHRRSSQPERPAAASGPTSVSPRQTR